MVGVQGFEPWTPCSQSRCATRLRYTPTESIFYTDRAIWSKSCKIWHMVAYFSSKLKTRFQGVIALGALVICLLGTQWVGLNHSISHTQGNQTIERGSTDQDPLLQHGSASCHLFDALSLASFITPSNFVAVVSLAPRFFSPACKQSLKQQKHLAVYQSRAPPTFILWIYRRHDYFVVTLLESPS